MGRRSNGEGSITKRKDGRWQAAVSVGTDENGKLKRKYFYARTKEEVTTKLVEATNSERSLNYGQTF